MAFLLLVLTFFFIGKGRYYKENIIGKKLN